MPGKSRQGRVQDPCHLGPRCQPLRQCNALLLVGLHPHRQGTQTAQRYIGVVWTNALAKLVAGPVNNLPAPFVADNNPHHYVTVAREIFSGCVHRDVYTMLEGFKKKRCRPGVVEDGRDAPCPGDRSDGGYILDFKGE